MIEANDAVHVFYGRVTEFAARVFAMYDGNQEATTVTGCVKGPYSPEGDTLPATADLKPIEGKLLAEAVVTDPCFWTTAQAATYRVEVVVKRDEDVLCRDSRSLGIRPYCIEGDNLFFAGSRCVLRSLAVRSPSATLLPQCRDTETTLLIKEPETAFLDVATRQGVRILLDLRDVDSVADALRRGVRAPCVVGAVLGESLAAGIPDNPHLIAPNLLFFIQTGRWDSTPAWADGYAIDASAVGNLARPPKPVLAVGECDQSVSQNEGFAGLRRAVDRLQASLAPKQCAGYLVETDPAAHASG